MDTIEILSGQEHREALAIARDYWSDKIDPQDAERKLYTMFRLAIGDAPYTTEIEELVSNFLEDNKQD
jgi:hypothetical protein